MQNTVLLVTALLAVVTAVPSDPECKASLLGIREKEAIQSAFISESVVPDLIPSISPEIFVEVHYGSRKAELGNFLLPNGTYQSKPHLPPQSQTLRL